VLRGGEIFDELEVGGEEGGVEGVQRGHHPQERVVSATLAEAGKTGGGWGWGGGGARATDGAVDAFASNAGPAADAEAGPQRHKQLRKRRLRRG
jgi:hypothetical protein